MVDGSSDRLVGLAHGCISAVLVQFFVLHAMSRDEWL